MTDAGSNRHAAREEGELQRTFLHTCNRGRDHFNHVILGGVEIVRRMIRHGSHAPRVESTAKGATP